MLELIKSYMMKGVQMKDGPGWVVVVVNIVDLGPINQNSITHETPLRLSTNRSHSSKSNVIGFRVRVLS